MTDPKEPLILDLVAWVADSPKPYLDVMDAWRTSCPRLTVWEDAVDRGWRTTPLDVSENGDTGVESRSLLELPRDVHRRPPLLGELLRSTFQLLGLGRIVGGLCLFPKLGDMGLTFGAHGALGDGHDGERTPR